MTGGRTIWRARDASWWTREWIVILAEEFGAEGPAVIDWLEDQAKLQNDGGRVKAGARAVSRGTTVDAVTVGHVVSRAVALGLLVEYEEKQGRFECVIVWFKADQGKGGSTLRKADQRARESDNTGDHAPAVTVGHVVSRAVAECPPTGQDNTEQNKVNSTAEPRLDEAREQSKQINELFAYWQERCGHPHAKLSSDRRSAIKGRLREDYTPEQIRLAIDGAAVGANTSDSNGKTFDDIELICRNGSKLESFIGRQPSTGGQSQRAQVIADQNDFKRFYPNGGKSA